MLRALLSAFCLATCAGGPGSALAAPPVALAGVLGSKALLVVGGGAPRAVAPGDTHEGVKVVSVGKDEAVIEVDGARHTVRMGDAPVSVGAGRSSGSGAGRRIVLTSDSRGHFINTGTINGKIMQYMVDTGASTVAIGRPEADRMGLDYQRGAPVMMGTANGTALGWRIQLDAVRLGDVEVRDVEAVVTPQAMPFVLLGNSFLNQFQMTRTNDQLVLDRRN